MTRYGKWNGQTKVTKSGAVVSKRWSDGQTKATKSGAVVSKRWSGVVFDQLSHHIQITLTLKKHMGNLEDPTQI